MGHYIALFMTIALTNFSLSYCAQPIDKQLTWFTNYEQALQAAKIQKKPLVLFFTGSDWCGWCTKLDTEVWNTAEFSKLAGDKFVFLKLDFPRETTLDARTKEQNRQLKSQFNIRSFPTVVLFDSSQQRQIGTTGYRAGGPKSYAQHLIKLLNEYHGYNQSLQTMETTTLSGNDLKQLYDKSYAFSFTNDMIRIIKKGLQSDEQNFFRLAQYHLLADEGMLNTSEAFSLKEQLLASDPQNKAKIPYQLAIIDFEAISEDSDMENLTAEQVIAPLTAYIEKYGQEDRENSWRLQMIISQVYLDKDKIGQALKHAQCCYEGAPPAAQSEIGFAIKNIRLQTQQAY